ncbi:hypothetical protein MRX96_010656 [Rhipicephalus microplus]
MPLASATLGLAGRLESKRQTKHDAGAIKNKPKRAARREGLRRRAAREPGGGVVLSPWTTAAAALLAERNGPALPGALLLGRPRRGQSEFRFITTSAPALRPEQQVAGVLVTAQSVTVSNFGSRSARLPASSSLPGVASRNAHQSVRLAGTFQREVIGPVARAAGGPATPLAVPASVCERAAPTPGSPGTRPRALWPTRPGFLNAVADK